MPADPEAEQVEGRQVEGRPVEGRLAEVQLAEHAERLAAGVGVALPGWVERAVAGRR